MEPQADQTALWINLATIAATLVTGFGASWAGAYWAFTLEHKRRLAERRAEQVSAGRRAMFALTQQHNAVRNLYDQSISTIRTIPVGWAVTVPIGMPPCAPIDLDSLGFLHDFERGQLLFELFITQCKFAAVVEALRVRAELHAELQRVLEPHLSGSSHLPDAQRLEQMAGDRLTRMLKSITDDLIRQVDQFLENNLEMAEKLHAELVLRLSPDRFPRLTPRPRP